MCARSISTRKVCAVVGLDLDVEPAVEGDRLVVLRGLEVLRHVRVEVVLPREPAPLGDLAVQRQADADGRLDAFRVEHRQRAGQAQADRADLGVGLGAELRRAAAEHLRGGAELDVHLEADDRVEARSPRRRTRAGSSSGGSSRRQASARLLVEQRPAPAVEQRLQRGADAVEPVVGHRRRHDLQADRQAVLGPGRSAATSPGLPARLAGMVATSLRYIASGSSSFSPSRNAVVGAVGETSTSPARTRRRSRAAMSVRTFCACRSRRRSSRWTARRCRA
jgi:hypothetical protein